MTRTLVVVVTAMLATLAMFAVPESAFAHPLNPALLDVRETSPGMLKVQWRVPSSGQGNAPIAPVLPAKCKNTGMPAESLTHGGQTVSRSWTMDCGGQSLVGESLAVNGLDARRTETLLRVELADGRVLQSVLRAGSSSFHVPARSTTAEIVLSYGKLGFLHILSGVDHLAFVLGLLLLVANRRHLWWTITAFTAGHSVTLSLAALGMVNVPSRPVEVLIAVSIFVLAVELARPVTSRRIGMRPWWMAGGFGLLHGLGFAGALSEAGLPRGEIPAALLSFNAGIEIGQLLFVISLLVLWSAVRRIPLTLPAAVRHAIPAYGIGALAVSWVFERL